MTALAKIWGNVEGRLSARISIQRTAEWPTFCCHSVQERGLSLT